MEEKNNIGSTLLVFVSVTKIRGEVKNQNAKQGVWMWADSATHKTLHGLPKAICKYRK